MSRNIDECRNYHHNEALRVLAKDGLDLFTECEDGHPQLDCPECDGVHCYRSCDSVSRAICRRMWKMSRG